MSVQSIRVNALGHVRSSSLDSNSLPVPLPELIVGVGDKEEDDEIGGCV